MVVGHERILRFLGRVMSRDRVAHAYGFFGPEGVGKRMVARAFSRALFCDRSSGLLEMCFCKACVALAKGVHPDVRELSPGEGRELGIGEIRGLAAFLSLTPFVGPRKVAIIDDAHRMTPQAAHALLKNLEDPPEHSVLILVTKSLEQLFPTLRSRLVPVRFRRLTPQEFARIHRAREANEWGGPPALPDRRSSQERTSSREAARLPDRQAGGRAGKLQQDSGSRMFAGRPGFAARWEKEHTPHFAAVRSLLEGDFRKRLSLLSRRDKAFDPPLGRLLELSSLLVRDALLTSLGLGELAFLESPTNTTSQGKREALNSLQDLLRLQKLTSLFNLSPKLTRDTFLFTAPQLAL